jgi:hypothetical protein
MIRETVTILSQKFPEATRAECKRFLLCHCRANADSGPTAGGVAEAEKSLQDYLTWRKRLGMDVDGDLPLSEFTGGNVDFDDDRKSYDALLWAQACRRCEVINHQDVSNGFNDNVSSLSSSSGPDTKVSKPKSLRRRRNSSVKKSTWTLVVPQFVFLHQSKHGTGATVLDNNGNKVLHVLPAMIDTKNVTAECYGRTLQFYLDRILGRHSEEKISVLLDVRPGEGWPNPLAIFMVPFIRKIARMLQGRFPGRLEKLVVFPVPLPALGVFHAVQWAFHAELMEKIVLISGPAERTSPLPKSELTKYISEANLKITENARLEKFLT